MTEHSRETPQFFLTAESPCPYLKGQQERKIFTHLVGERADDLNDVLSHGGFRRSQNIAYRPACEACRACVSVRTVVDGFSMSRNLKRVWKRNSDLISVDLGAEPTTEQYSIFRAYLDARHHAGGMSDMSSLDYAMMIEDTYVDTHVIEYRKRDTDSGITGSSQEPLLATALTDRLTDGLSMVYSFFDPDEASRGLGTYMILDHIERAKKLGLAYLYLGYWVEGSRKMDYKARFLPQERLGAMGWARVE